MDSKVSIPDLDFEYKLWKNRLKHYTREARIYISRLQSVKTATPELTDALIRAFDRITDTAHALYKEIEVHEEEMAYYKKDYPISKSHQHFADHEKIRERFRQFNDKYQTLVDQMSRDVEALYFV